MNYVVETLFHDWNLVVKIAHVVSDRNQAKVSKRIVNTTVTARNAVVVRTNTAGHSRNYSGRVFRVCFGYDNRNENNLNANG